MSEQNESEPRLIQKRQKEPLAPDGKFNDLEDVGNLLTYKRIINAIYSETKINVASDDPILMIVPVLNAFLNEQKNRNIIYCKAIKTAVSDSTKSYVNQVCKTTQQLGTALKEASIVEIRDIFSRNSENLHAHRIYVKNCTIIIAASAAINVLLFIYMALSR